MEGLMDGCKNILCVRLDNLGDVLMCSPAVRAIKESMPDAQVTFLVSPTGARIARLMPAVDHILVFEAPWVKSTPPQADNRVLSSTIRQLKSYEFDAAIVFTTYSQSPLPAAFLCFQAGIPIRIAFCRENPYQLLTHWQKEEEPDIKVRHEVQRQLDLVRIFGCVPEQKHLRIAVGEYARKSMKILVSRFRMPWFILHAGATAASRRYPLESYARIVRDMGKRGWTAVLSGVEEEKNYTEELNEVSGKSSINLCGQLTLEEFCALLSESPFLLSNNTGVVHLASATQTPVVVLYALTNPQHTPWLVPHRVLFEETDCKYCYKSVCPQNHHKCLREVSPERVLKAIDDLLKENSPQFSADHP